MTKTKMYRYVGRNGMITSSVLLDGINHFLMYRLFASEGYMLTDGEKILASVTVFEDEINNWYEIPKAK